MTDARKIAVISNVHLAAARQGWDEICDQYPDHRLTFFGAPRDFMKDLVLKGGMLVPGTDRLRAKLRLSSGGLEAIRLDAYDEFILYGLQFGHRSVVQLYRTHRPISFEWREALPDLAPMRRGPDRVTSIAEHLFDRAIRAGLAHSIAMRLIAQIRTVTDRPVHLIPAPGFAEAALETGDWDGVLGAGDLDRLAARYADLAKAACPDDVTLVEHPEELRAFGLFTARDWCKPVGEDGAQDLLQTAPAYAARLLERALRGAEVSAQAMPAA